MKNDFMGKLGNFAYSPSWETNDTYEYSLGPQETGLTLCTPGFPTV